MQIPQIPPSGGQDLRAEAAPAGGATARDGTSTGGFGELLRALTLAADGSVDPRITAVAFAEARASGEAEATAATEEAAAEEAASGEIPGIVVLPWAAPWVQVPVPGGQERAGDGGTLASAATFNSAAVQAEGGPGSVAWYAVGDQLSAMAGHAAAESLPPGLQALMAQAAETAATGPQAAQRLAEQLHTMLATMSSKGDQAGQSDTLLAHLEAIFAGEPDAGFWGVALENADAATWAKALETAFKAGLELAGDQQSAAAPQPVTLAPAQPAFAGQEPAPVSAAAGATEPALMEETARPTLATLSESTIKSVRYMAREGIRSMTVRLVPENLGELKLDVTATDDVLTVRLAAANAAVRDVLEAQLHVLREALARDGFAQLRTTVSSNQDGSNGQEAGQWGSGPHERSTGFGGGSRQPDTPPVPDGTFFGGSPERDGPVPMTGEGLSEGSLDLFV